MAVVGKKKPKAKAKARKASSKGVREDKPSTEKAAPQRKSGSVIASKKTAAKEAAPKKRPAKKKADEAQPKHNPVKHHRICAPEAGAQIEADATSVRELDPFEIAKQTMKGSVPAIVEAMVEAAKQGSYTHAKTLLEMTGAKHMFDNDAGGTDSGESWAKLVLARLDEAESGAGQLVVDLKDEALEVVAE